MPASPTPDPFITRTPGWQSPRLTGSYPRLSGLRLAVKDLFHICGLPTTAGNPDWARSHPVPTQTSSVVSALLSHGAQLVGKTITDELAYSLNGQNWHYGTPLNPLTPDRLPGGSSSGSATAVAADLADIGLGTDTGGSIRVPASYNSLFGLRPTHGAVACDNMVPLAPSFDTVGWMTASLNTLQQVAEVVLPRTESLPAISVAGLLTDYLQLADHKSQLLQWWSSVCARMSTTSLSFAASTPEPGQVFRVLQGAEIWQTHGQWLTDTQPALAPDIAERLQWCRSLTDSDVNSAKQQQQQVCDQVDQWFSQCDVIMLPTTPGLAPRLDTPADELADYRNRLLNFTALAGLAGLPQLHLPLFTFNGAPCGVSLLGQKGHDLALLALARQLTEPDT